MNNATPSSVGMNEAAIKRVCESVQADIDAGRHFGASILIARHGKVVCHQQLGMVAPGRATDANDKFLLMSMSKSFTALLVLRAIDQGRFHLDTRVSELVPGFETGGKAKVTIRQLMNHTSGLPFGLVPPGMSLFQCGDLKTKAEAIAALPISYSPGTRCIYTSGLGYDLLGHILVATDPQQRSFQQITQEDLFAPLGMRNTSFGLPVKDPHRVPVSFPSQNVTPTTPLMLKMFNETMDENALLPSGNAYSTLDDVFRFTEVLRGRGTANGYRLLSPSLLEYARQNHTGELINEAVTSEVESKHLEPLRANFTLLGGYVRGIGHYITAAGQTASPDAIAAVGGASTSWMIDFQRDLTVIFLSAGFIEGLNHIVRVQHINDLSLAAIEN